eukprot:Protomagalhaensia_wolfi_Nauph_80__3395@NODE_3450_length_797_cov_31_973615_g2710_i0_p1_GENE_NODE_3450_length_797_cov_31_973615_g2710_i0NODE_3450_length_797_cov_31_973615_g2710_i0_p1_ORF_typecomplete_len215_score35_46Tyr_Deacylase/PF02580_16/1_9e49_NODE_3450_length_797_cov_31_973615_g2710_i0114758
MRVVLQRVRSAKVEVAGEEVNSIEQGLLILWGIQEGDDWAEAEYCIRKSLNAKLWDENQQREAMNRTRGFVGARVGEKDSAQIEGEGRTWAKSVMDMGFEVLIVSQFTLFGSVKKGNKPDFHYAMAANKSRDFLSQIIENCKAMYSPDKIKTGSFGSYMQVSLVNDGPVTLYIEQPPGVLKPSKISFHKEYAAKAGIEDKDPKREQTGSPVAAS